MSHDKATKGNDDNSDDIAKSFEMQARPFLDLVDDLRKIGIQKKIEIPQIAVMGDQSSGKSSVLEAISGIPFPRGSGLVTRCATQLTMSHGDKWRGSVEILGDAEFKRKEITKASEIAGEIESITKRICGDSGGFSKDKTIVINVQAPNVPDLTIIDLPGIVRTTVKGQDDSVIKDVNSLIETFLKSSRTIILAVMGANRDIATSDILERASKVDPEGTRTMGVLTMPDLVDSGAESEVIAVLANRKKPLKHGYVMLKNRSQKDLTDGMSIEDARKAERRYFEEEGGTMYAREGRVGVDALTKVLTGLLVNHIQAALPAMREEINVQIRDAVRVLSELGESPPSSSRDCRSAVREFVREIARHMRSATNEGAALDDEASNVLSAELDARKRFEAAVSRTKPGFDGEADTFMIKGADVPNGTYGPVSWKESRSVTKIGDKFPPPLRVGSKVERKYGINWYKCNVVKVNKDFTYHLKDIEDNHNTRTVPISMMRKIGGGSFDCSVAEMKTYFRGDIARAIRKGRGREIPGFLNFKVFTRIMAGYTSKWQSPCREFGEFISKKMREAFESAIRRHPISRLANGLRHKALRDVEKFLDDADEDFRKRTDCAHREEMLPMTENHYLFDTINKLRDKRVSKQLDRMFAGKDTMSKEQVLALLKSNIGDESNESQEVQDMIDLLKSYWKLAKKRYVDRICMTVANVYTCKDHIAKIESKLSDSLYDLSDDEMRRMFAQSAEIENKRKSFSDLLRMLQDAKDRIDRVF